MGLWLGLCLWGGGQCPPCFGSCWLHIVFDWEPFMLFVGRVTVAEGNPLGNLLCNPSKRHTFQNDMSFSF